MVAKSKDKERRHLTMVVPKLNAWWGTANGSFSRVPASGALRWNNGHWTYADLIPPSDFPFCVECKFHKAMDLDEVIRLRADNGKITWFWYWQTIRDANRATEELKRTIFPLLIYRVNCQPDHLVLQEDLFSRIPMERRTFPYLQANIPNATPFCICLLDQFLEAITRADFEEHVLRRSL